MPMPSPIRVPSADSSKGRMIWLLENAGVLLKHMYMRIVFSASQPPVIIRSERPSTSSLTASLTAASALAQAASTVQLVPPRSKRLAMRPATTLPSMPGKEFSSQGMYAFLKRSATSSAWASLSPTLRTTSFRTGVWSRAESGWVSELAPVTPRMTPVRVGSYQPEPSVPASRRTSRATVSERSWRMSVTSRVFGGRPNSIGLKAISGRNPPRRA